LSWRRCGPHGGFHILVRKGINMVFLLLPKTTNSGRLKEGNYVLLGGKSARERGRGEDFGRLKD